MIEVFIIIILSLQDAVAVCSLGLAITPLLVLVPLPLRLRCLLMNYCTICTEVSIEVCVPSSSPQEYFKSLLPQNLTHMSMEMKKGPLKKKKRRILGLIYPCPQHYPSHTQSNSYLSDDSAEAHSTLGNLNSQTDNNTKYLMASSCPAGLKHLTAERDEISGILDHHLHKKCSSTYIIVGRRYRLNAPKSAAPRMRRRREAGDWRLANTSKVKGGAIRFTTNSSSSPAAALVLLYNFIFFHLLTRRNEHKDSFLGIIAISTSFCPSNLSGPRCVNFYT